MHFRPCLSLTPFTIIMAVLAGCSPQPSSELSIGHERTATQQSKPFKPDVSSRERFGLMGFPGGDRSPAHGGQDRGKGTGLDFELPPGWSKASPAPMRLINLKIDAGAECYLSHSGGGLLPNVNRWLGQLGEAPLSADALEELPTLRVLGKDAVYVERTGTLQGKADSMLVGILLPHVLKGRPGLLTVKMIGPAAVVKGEIERFQALCGSLKEANEHAGHNHGPNEGHGEPPGPSGPSPHGPSGPNLPNAGPTLNLTWTTPRNWNEEAPRPMREVTFAIGDTECYVSALRGEGGGVEANVTRWRAQLGVDVPLNFSALPRVPMLGRNGILVRAEGTYTGMEGEAHPGYALIGAICKVQGMTVFVKMIGPKAEIDAQREAFMAFCASLKQEK